MKKKIIGIVCVSLGSILLSILLAFGVFTFIKNRNVATTGNVLGVSWYNETDKSFTISTVEQLYEVAELAKFYKFKGQTIKLAADLVVNEGNVEDWANNAPSRKWKPINGFAGTFDGQGHTISGLYAKVFGSPLALFTNTDQSCTIKNLRLVNTYFEASGLDSLASFVATGGGKFYQLYSDAILECKGEKVAGLASRIQKASKFEECWYDGSIHSTSRDVGGLIDEIYSARVEMKHCLFSGTIEQDYTVGGTRTGGICGRIREKASLIMDDCLSTGKIIADKTVYSGALLGVVYSGGQIKTTDCFVSSDVYHLLIGESGEQGSIDGRPLQMSGDMLIGTKAYEWTTLNFDKYWAAVEGDTPILRCFGEQGMSLEGVEKAFDVSWYTPGNYIYELTTLKQLYGLYILSGGNNFAEHTIKLGADIVVNEGKASDWEKNAPENPWFAINKFNGIFDGQGHSISGVYLKNQMTYQGFFAQVEPAGIVRNFSLKNSYFCNDSDGKLAMLGSIAGEFRGKLENVYSNAIVTSSGTQAGGIFGRTNDNDDDGKEDKVVITNCWFDGELQMKGQGGRYGGGFVGLVVQGDLDVSHCLNTGHISAEAVNIGVHVGGFVGSTWNKGVLNMNDCLSAGTMDVAYTVCVGSVLGRSEAETRTVNLSNVYATKECFNVTFFGTGEGGATTAKVNGVAIMIPGKLVTGFKAYEWTYLDFAEHWAIVKEGTPILRAFAGSTPSTAGYTKKTNFDWYKADKTTYTIKTAEEFYGFALLSCSDTFKGKTIQLGADIAVNAGDAATYATNVPELEWISIGSPSAYFMGTFDGQGHTISGLYLNTEETYGGLFAMTAEGSVVKNFRLTNSYFCYSGKSSAILGSVVGDMYSASTMENVYSNATVVSHGHQTGGLVGRVNDSDAETDKTTDKAVIRNCWFDGNLSLKGETTVYGGGIVGYLFRGDLDMSHCLNAGNLSTEATGRALQFGGLIGSVYNYGTLNLIDSLSTGILDVNYSIGVGSVIGRVSCEKQNQRIVNITDTYVLADSYEVPVGTSAATAKINGAPAPLKEKFLTGYTAYQWTTLDFAENWAVVDGDTPVLQKFATSVPSVAGQTKMINLDWYNPDAEKYEIKTAEQLRGFAVLASGNTFKDKTVLLKENIDLKEEQWIPIGSTSANFKGTFEGQGKTISGLKLDTQEYYGGLFGIVGSGGVVKNFRLTESEVTYSGTGAAILGSVVADLYGGATLENVYSSATVVSCGQQAGGIVGRVNDNDEDKKEDKAVISNCWFDGQFSLTGATTTYGGGIVGYLFRGDLDMSHCLNTGSLSSEATGRALHFGGLVGSVNASGTLNLADNLNTGILNVKHDIGVGSVIGRISTDDPKARTVNIEDTYALAGSYKVLVGTSTKYRSHGAVTPMPKSILTGYTAYQWTELDFKDNWAVVEDGTPVLQTFATKVPSLFGYTKLFDLDWYDEDKTKYELRTKKELRGFALAATTDDFKGKTITLKADMNLKDKEWLPIGSSFKPFAGTFDGQMKTIEGIYLNTSEQTAGLFGEVAETGTVSNFYLKDSYFNSDYTVNDYGAVKGAYFGSVVGVNRGTVSTVYSDALVVSAHSQVGGIVGRAINTSSIRECWFDGEVQLTSKSYGRNSGGVVGYAYVESGKTDVVFDIVDCLFTGTITTPASSGANSAWGIGVGGILGQSYGPVDFTINIENCISAGTMDLTYTAGDADGAGVVIGGIESTRSQVKLTNVYGTNECCEKAPRIYYLMSGVDASITGKGIMLNEADLQGTSGYKNTLLDFGEKGAWVARKDEVPALKAFSKNITATEDITNVIRPDRSWYKEEDTKQYIKDVADLLGFTQLMLEGNTFEGKEVYLAPESPDYVFELNQVDADTLKEWKERSEIPENKWIGTGTKFAGTFDGQMNTIKGVYVDATVAGAGLFGEIGATGKVSNLYIEDSLFMSTATSLGSVAGKCSGTISTVFSNAYVVGANLYSGGIVGLLPQSASVDNCWFDGELRLTDSSNGKESGGIVGYIDGGGTYNLTNCLYTGKIYFATTSTSAWGRKIGGIIGGAHDWDTPTINMENCLSAGTMECSTNKNATGMNGISSVFGGLDVEALTLNLINVYGTNECYQDAKQIYDFYSGTAAIITGKGIMFDEADLKGTSGYQNTLLDFEENGAWVARKDNVPGLKAFTKVLGETVSIANVEQNNWYNANETVFGIGSASALKSLGAISVANDFSGKTILLLDDIEVNKVEEGTLDAWKAGTGTLPASWTPIGVTTRFNGTFDGQMHTISGVYLNTSSQFAGLFGQIWANGIVKNFYITDSLFKSTSYDIGSVAGASYGTVDTVYSNATIITEKYRSGGIVGHVPWHNTTAYIKNCWFDGQMELGSSASQAGGILGYIAQEWKAAVSITNCLYTGSIDFKTTSTNWGLRIGGIVGGARDYYTPTITIENCLSAGKITQSSGSTATPAVSAVYGGFDEGRATTLNLTNVYGTNECFAEARIYHQYIANGGATGATLTINGTGTLLTEAGLYGELAKTNASALDYTAVWVTRDGKVPALKAFVK